MGGHRRQDCIGPTARAYRVWKQLRVFEHGDMNEPGRALDTFLEHARIAGALDTESHLPRILAHLPTNSVDFCLSNAVLEHVPKRDLALVAAELFRVLNRNGICVHRVDLKDHLGGGLNNLRFSEATWEGTISWLRVLC